MRAVAYPRHWLENPLLFPLAVLITGLLWLATARYGMPVPLAIVLMIQAVVFLLLLSHPVWAIAALIVGQLTASGFMFDLAPQLRISIHLLWALMAVIFLLPVLAQKRVRLGSGARRVIIPALVLFALATVSNALNTDLAYTFQYFRQTATALAILLLLPAVVDDERDVKLLSVVALVASTVSALVAILQYLDYAGIDGLPAYTLVPMDLSEGRMPGLTESPLLLAFNLPVVLLFLFGVLLASGVGRNTKRILVLSAAVMLVALYLTFTRSAFYALAPGLLAIALLLKGRMRKELVLVALIAGVAFFYSAGVTASRYSQGFTAEESAASRLVLWQSGLSIARDHPLIGIGHERYSEVSLEHLSAVDPRFAEMQGAGRALGQYEPHNDFINVWLSFGTPALVAFLWLIAAVFRNFTESYRQSSSRFLKGFALGGGAALTAWCVNAATHNVMDSLFTLWIIAGLSIAVAKLSRPGQRHKEEIPQ